MLFCKAKVCRYTSIATSTKIYTSKLDFELENFEVGNSEMQHLDFAYASSLIYSFLENESLVLTENILLNLIFTQENINNLLLLKRSDRSRCWYSIKLLKSAKFEI